MDEKFRPASKGESHSRPKASLFETLKERLGIFAMNIREKDAALEHIDAASRAVVAAEANLIEVTADMARETALAATHEDVGVESRPRLKEGESILQKEHPFEYLAAVRVTEHLPVLRDGRLIVETPFMATAGVIARPTLHFTINTKVETHALGNWDAPSFAILAPMDKMVEENGIPYGFGAEDTYWLTEQGIRLPEDSVMLVREDKAQDPAVQELIAACSNAGVRVSIESARTDSASISDRLKDRGYGYYGGDEVDQGLRAKYQIETGGYASHLSSWLSTLEKSFTYGNPAFSFSSREKNIQARFTPGDQLENLERYTQRLNPQLQEQYLAIAMDRLLLLAHNPARRDEFLRLKLEVAAYDSTEETLARLRAAELTMYSQSLKALFGNGALHVVSERLSPDALSSFMDVVTERLRDPAYTRLDDGSFSESVLESISRMPQEMRSEFVQRIADTGGAHALEVLFTEPCAESLSEDDRAVLITGIRRNPEAFKTLMKDKDFRSFQEKLKTLDSDSELRRSMGDPLIAHLLAYES